MPAHLCPKCRSLGLSTDCSERLLHAKKKNTMIRDYDEGVVEMEVTVSFMAPVTSSLDRDPSQMATYMRETWIEEPGALGKVITDALDDDYDVSVKPVSGL